MKFFSVQIESKSFLIRLGILLALAIAGCVLALSELIPIAMIGIFILGAMFAHAIELQHQCLHYTAFRSRRLNSILGVLLGLPTLTSFHAYRRSHLEHHRNLGAEGDAPFFTYRFLESRTLGAFIVDLFGLTHLKASILAIFGNTDSRLISIPISNEPNRISERFDYGLMGFLIVCACLYSMTFGFVIVLKLWLLPLVFVAQPIHFLIELPEHIGCTQGSTDPFRNTRTIAGSAFSRWFTNFNNLHVEHHLDPSLRMNQLPALFAKQKGNHYFLNTTYPQFYISIVRMVYSASPLIAADEPTRRPA
jgi:fatty acid desaturase